MTPFHQEDAVTIYHGKAEDILPALGSFDLLLADPPYGIGESNRKNLSRGRSTAKWKAAKATDYGEFTWDKKPISPELLALMRSKADVQVIFGGNYYTLPPTPCWLVWDKETSGDFADCELAWTNMERAVRKFRYLWNGFQKAKPETRYHPTQKPLALYQWVLGLVPECQTILDPMCGSGTTGVAAKNLGRKAVLVEQDERHCETAAKRLCQQVLALEEA